MIENGQIVAVKSLHSTLMGNQAARDRFIREAQAAASLSHPHCVYVFSAEEIQGFPVITMELMPGGTLQDRINDVGPLPYREAVDYILQIVRRTRQVPGGAARPGGSRRPARRLPGAGPARPAQA